MIVYSHQRVWVLQERSRDVDDVDRVNTVALPSGCIGPGRCSNASERCQHVDEGAACSCGWRVTAWLDTRRNVSRKLSRFSECGTETRCRGRLLRTSRGGWRIPEEGGGRIGRETWTWTSPGRWSPAVTNRVTSDAYAAERGRTRCAHARASSA